MDAATSPPCLSSPQPRDTWSSSGQLFWTSCRCPFTPQPPPDPSPHLVPWVLPLPGFRYAQLPLLPGFSVSSKSPQSVSLTPREVSVPLHLPTPHTHPGLLPSLITLSDCAFISVWVRTCRQVLYVSLASVTCVPVDPARGSYVSVYWLRKHIHRELRGVAI